MNVSRSIDQKFAFTSKFTYLFQPMSEPLNKLEVQQWNRLRKGDASALEWLYNQYFKILYNYGMKICGRQRLAEDAIHDLFVDLWRFRSNLSTTTSVRFYLYRAMRRKLMRAQSARIVFSDEDEHLDHYLPAVRCMEDDLIESERHTQQSGYLKKLLQDLSPRQYEALVLRFYDELSFDEIGGILNVNAQSARNLVQRGLSQLRRYARLLSSFLILLTTV